MKRLTVPVGKRDCVQGPEDAPATLLEYGNYECPRCKQAHSIVREIQKQLGNQLRFAFRHFPLTAIHPMSRYAAEVAEAANAQGQFWEIHNYLMEHQQSSGNGALLKYATQLGLDMDRFEREIAEHLYADRVYEDIQSGLASGVNGTPTFFINGIRHEGAWVCNNLLTAINATIHPPQK